MRRYFSAACWASAILLLAIAARFDAVDRNAADLLLLVLPMIAFTTMIGRRGCQPSAKEI